MPELSGIMPPVPDDLAGVAPNNLSTDYEAFENHGALDSDDEAVKIINEYVDKGYLKSFDTLADCTAFVGGDPILSKFA